MSTPEVFVVRDRPLLQDAVAARLITHLVDRIAAAGAARLLLSDHPLVVDVLTAVGRGPARDAVDWHGVQVWWANSNWRTGSADHATAHSALAALRIPATAMHQIPPVTATSDPEETAARYAKFLLAAKAQDDHGLVPTFDVALLAVGNDGSIAGLHPEAPTAYAEQAVAVDRATSEITLTGPALSTARDVWLLAAGSGPAPGVHLAVSAAGPFQVPAAGVRGIARTLLLVDEAAAARLPLSLRRIASP
jgi:6-phosphogluconolactonase